MVAATFSSRRDRSDVALLVGAAAAGDQEAWDGLVEAFASTVWAVCRAHRLNPVAVTDVFLATWFRLFAQLDLIEQPERVGAWLATTALSECLRLLGLPDRQVATPYPFEAPEGGGRSSAAGMDLRAEQRQRLVNELVGRLPPRPQVLLRLLGADSPLSYKEISEVLSMPIGSIGPTRRRAVDRLKRLALDAGLSVEDVLVA